MAAFLARPASSSPDLETEGEFSYEVSDTGNNSMKVVVRVRPESEAELRSSCHCVVKVLDEHVLIFDPAGHQTSGATGDGKKPFLMSSPGMSRFFGGRRLRPLLAKKHKDLRFAFDCIFDETSTQTQVFKHTTQSILDGVLDGINCSVFAYGATGAGKTHTMLGSPEDPGVIFLTMRELYHRIEALKDTKTCTISVSYCEVYNETIRDLLAPSGPLNLREDSEQGLVVSGLSSHIPSGAEEILAMLEQGNANRTQHPTEANATSSRSHAVFQVMVEQRPRTAALSTDVTQAKLSLIDLAGSERATVTANRGARLREGANINRSLLALGNCINALAASKGKPGYVPYRDSKLTRLLKDSLGGNCRTVMVANVSPSALCYEDTYNTLKYADRAKQIKTTLVRNVLHVDYHLSKYKVIIQDLQKEITELKGKISSASSRTSIYDPKEAARLCGMVGDVYGERGRLRKHMADLDAKERETLLKVCRKERDLSRIELLWCSDVKKGKITSRICALKAHLTDIQRQKQTVNEYLFSNNETVGRVQKEVNDICKEHQGGELLLQLMESVTEARKLEVESGYQWKQTKHLLKYIKNQEREISRTERLLCLSLSLVQRQHQLIQDAGLDSSHLQDDLSCLSGLAQGDKGVAWADQTRISTNDLHDVSTASLTSTQQQLFDCFLDHSSPRVSRKFFPPKTGPHMSPHLGILTSATAAQVNANKGADDTALGEESDEGSTTPTPTPSSSQGSGGTVTLRTTFSAHTPPHHSGNSVTSQNSSLPNHATSSNSVRVTTDVCFNSAHRPPPTSPSPSYYSDRDDISEVSSSGLGSTNSDPMNSDPMNSDPMQDQDELDYDKLASMSHDFSGRSRDLTSIMQQSATHYKWHRPLPPATPTKREIMYQNRPGATPYHSTTQSSVEPAPIAREMGASSIPATPRTIPLPPRRELAAPVAPQPYSQFQPLRPPPRPSKGTPPTSSSRMTPTSCATPTSLSSHKSISADSGLGSITGSIVPQGPGGMLRRTPLLPPHRPNANGVMVRSSPSNTLPHSSHMSGFSYATRITGFEDNFVSPPPLLRQHHNPESMSSKDDHVTVPMKVPIGAYMSPLQRPFGTRAAPNPYVQDPGHQPRPLTSTLSTGNIHNGSIYRYQDALPKPAALSGKGSSQTSSRLVRKSGHKSLSKQTSLSGSKGSLSDVESGDDHALNSTFTVAVDVGCRGQQVGGARVAGSTCGSTASSSSSDGGSKKSGQGRGMFGRSKISKLPSYQKMTKSAESKKTSRIQNKENMGQQSTGTHSNGHLRLNKVALNRSRDGLNSTNSNSSSITMSTRFNSAPQLAW